MNTDTRRGMNNILLVSLILSLAVHFVLLQSKWVIVGSETHNTLAVNGDEIQIPIEFIPNAQKNRLYQYSESSLEEIKKLLEEANESKPVVPKASDIQSFNQVKSAIRHYLLSVREEIEKNKKISAISSYTELVGRVKIGFSISGNGLFSDVQILETSGDKLLDQSATQAIYSSNGKIKRPPTTGHKTIQTSAVIKYQYGL